MTNSYRRGGLRARDKLLERDPDYYKKIGAKGGKAKVKKGFAMMDKEKLRALGRAAVARRWGKENG